MSDPTPGQPDSELDSDPQEFARVGGYDIVERLRDGGMAALFLARRPGAHGFSRPVALKIMHEAVASEPQMRQMFVDEALLGSHLQHPNIVPVEEFGEEDGRFFLVMEYVDGCSVSDLARHRRRTKKPLDPVIAVHVISEACRGLHHAHECLDADERPLGVVHRDVSPGNILLSRTGHTKVIDFGVAKSEFRTAHTVESLKGKFRYMSPEQARGKPLQRTTDVYSLGLVLWELLCNRRCIQGESDLARLEMAREPTIESPFEVAGIEEDLSDVVMKALSFDPDDRFPTAADFGLALRTAMPEVVDFPPRRLGDAVRVTPGGYRSRAELASSTRDISHSLSLVSQPSFTPSGTNRRPPLPPARPNAIMDSLDGVSLDMGQFAAASPNGANAPSPTASAQLPPPAQESERRGSAGLYAVAAAIALLALVLGAFLLFGAPPDRTSAPSANPAPATLTPSLPVDPATASPLVPPVAVAPTPFAPVAEPPPVAPAAPTPVAATNAPAGQAPDRETDSRAGAGSRAGTGGRPTGARRSGSSPDVRVSADANEAVVQTRGDSRPERVNGFLLDTGGEDDTRLPRRSQSDTVRAGSTLLAE